MALSDTVDWSKFTDPPCTTVTCRCGYVFRSHAKTVKVDGRWIAVSKEPCIQCGRSDNIWKVSTDPESFTIRG
jgi:hypothetical protein